MCICATRRLTSAHSATRLPRPLGQRSSFKHFVFRFPYIVTLHAKTLVLLFITAQCKVCAPTTLIALQNMALPSTCTPGDKTQQLKLYFLNTWAGARPRPVVHLSTYPSQLSLSRSPPTHYGIYLFAVSVNMAYWGHSCCYGMWHIKAIFYCIWSRFT